MLSFSDLSDRHAQLRQVVGLLTVYTVINNKIFYILFFIFNNKIVSVDIW